MTSPTPNVTVNDGAARAAGERETGMSDRTPSSVRVGSRGDTGAPTDNAPADDTATPAPVTSPRATPPAGPRRARAPAPGPSPAGPPAQPAGAPQPAGA